MLDSSKAFIQGYNAQATVDAETHIIVGADLSNIANDSPHLLSQIDEVEKNTGRKPKMLCRMLGTTVMITWKDYSREESIPTSLRARLSIASGAPPLLPEAGYLRMPHRNI